MSRRNNVRGPTSALTEFLRESGITPSTIARRARTREVPQPVAGPSTLRQQVVPDEEDNIRNKNYDSDHLDDSENERPLAKKRKLSKAKLKAQEKAKAKIKGKGKGKGKGKAKDDDDYEDGCEEEDAYTALSKMWKDRSKPPVGSFETCAKCETQFTMTKYTIAANPPPGFLCHGCAKASGTDPFKKPEPRKRKKPSEKRELVSFEERRLPTLASLCIKVIGKHINDVEALGDIGSLNMDEIAKALSKNRSLDAENATLFYDAANTKLTFYDTTNFLPPAYTTLALLNPNLTELRLDYCGRMNNTVIDAWSVSLPSLKRLELLGPFLVPPKSWVNFFETHPKLTGFLITQSPVFNIDCVRVLAEKCKDLTELKLKEIGKMEDEFLYHIKQLSNLASLEISYPGNPESLSEGALIDLMKAILPNLTHLDLSNNVGLTDGFLYQGLKPYARVLKSLVLSNVPELTDAGVAEFFSTWKSAPTDQGQNQDEDVEMGEDVETVPVPPPPVRHEHNTFPPNPPLTHIDLSRNHQLGDKSLLSLLRHSCAALVSLSINGWKSTSESALKQIAGKSPELKRLDMSWCWEADDWVIKGLFEKCERLEDLKVWGCQRVSPNCPRKRNVALQGVVVR